ncbi:PEGA domain-containing protein [Deinococcus koreensis]|uniref:PEGA domain-containing protein n=1 Tax=Deinococcus koreensis TaxID=2054903 RepID=A0A2K3UUV4_9DEIO|nr:PEGA domain-containing protein [Deinococcus koreensis]PNY80300.1 hypothetical protein CVO96_02005 [Deinococcus koreensis]
MKPIGPYVAARELPTSTNDSAVRTLRATDRLTGVPVLLHVLPYALNLPELPEHHHLLPFVDSGMDGEQAYMVSELPLQAVPATDATLAARGALAALVALHEHGLPHGGISPAQLWSVDGRVVLAGAGLPWHDSPTPQGDLQALTRALDEIGIFPAALRPLKEHPEGIDARAALALLGGPAEPAPPAPGESGQAADPGPDLPSGTPAAPQHDGSPIVLGQDDPETGGSGAGDSGESARSPDGDAGHEVIVIAPTTGGPAPRKDAPAASGGRTPRTVNLSAPARTPEPPPLKDAALEDTALEDAAPPAPERAPHTAAAGHVPESARAQDDPATPTSTPPSSPPVPTVAPLEFPETGTPTPPVPEPAPPAPDASDQAPPAPLESTSPASPVGRAPVSAFSTAPAGTIETPQERRRRQNEERRAQAMLDSQAAARRRAERLRADAAARQAEAGAIPPPIQIGFPAAGSSAGATVSSGLGNSSLGNSNLGSSGLGSSEVGHPAPGGIIGEDDLPDWPPPESGQDAGADGGSAGRGLLQMRDVPRLPESLRRPADPEPEPEPEPAPRSSGRLPARQAPGGPIRIGWDEDDSWRVVKAAPSTPARAVSRPPRWLLPLLAALIVLIGVVWMIRSVRPRTATAPPAAAACCDVAFTLRGAAGATARLTVESAPAGANLTPGQELGQAPGKVRFPVQGTYRLRVAADGYDPGRLSLTVPRTQPVSIDLGS